MADLRYELEHGFYAKEDSITIESWFETWMKEYKENSLYSHVLPDVKAEEMKKIANLF